MRSVSAKREAVSNAVRLHFVDDFVLSLEPVVQSITLALAAADKKVVGTKTNLMFQHPLGKPVVNNDWTVHCDHLDRVIFSQSSQPYYPAITSIWRPSHLRFRPRLSVALA